ncbi:MAG TPA: molybdopterin-binding protein [Syntrophales bacterium]|nr:molybdopterin-binding protein [Syntrophales bacterium]
MKSRYLETEKAVGKVLCHDMTQIIKGVHKGPRFKKGHVIREEDVPVLLSMGKHHIQLMDLDPGELHEEDAGLRLAEAVAGPGLALKGPVEGKYELIATTAGLLRVDAKTLLKINRIPQIAIVTLHDLTPVHKGEKVAGAKVVPLVIEEKHVTRVEALAKHAFPLIAVKLYRKIKVGGVITGREVCEGRIDDGFGPVLHDKTAAFGLEPPNLTYVSDDREKITRAILDQLDKGCELVLVTGGMSVDPDDVTPAGIRMTGAKIIRYGAPVMPGSMFLMAYKGDIPIIGVPGCAMYADTTILDLLLPRVLAGEKITVDDIVRFGHGGLCRGCAECVYPTCAFGKG